MRWFGVAIVGCWLAVFAGPAGAGDTEDYNKAVTTDKAGDYQKAFYPFKLLAEQGHAKAQADLGTMYLWGVGVPQNDVMAYAWFNVAVTQGDKIEFWRSSKDNIDFITKKLTPNQLAKGQELAAEYWEKYVVPFQEDKPHSSNSISLLAPGRG